MLFLHGDLLDHGLGRGQLVPAAEGHQDRACADGGVKPLRKASLGAGVQIVCRLQKVFRKGTGDLLFRRDRRSCFHGDVFFRTVGIQKFTADIHDGIAVPVHGEARIFRDHCYRGCHQVFLVGQFEECFQVMRLDHHGHTLLALADGQFRAVQAVVFFRDRIQVDLKTGCQFADGDRNAAGTEIIAALDHQGSVLVAEQPLKLSFFRRITFLDFRAAGFQGFHGMGFGRAGGSAAAVTSRGPAQQYHDVSRGRNFPADIFRRSRCDHGTDFHTLGGIAGMVDFIYDTRGQTDLVAVGRVAGGSRGHDLSLGKFALDGFVDRL